MSRIKKEEKNKIIFASMKQRISWKINRRWMPPVSVIYARDRESTLHTPSSLPPIENRRWIEFKANAFISVYRSLRRKGITIVNGRGSIAVPIYNPKIRRRAGSTIHDAAGLTFSNRPSSNADPIRFPTF